MSDLVLAEKDPNVVLAEALAIFKQVMETAGLPGTLQPADPRRLFLQTIVLLLAQQRALIDFSGKQSLLGFVSALWIEQLAQLWEEVPIPAKPSTCVERFSFSEVAAHTVPAGTRVTDGTNQWKVLADTTATDNHVDAAVECLITGAASNGVAIGQIDQLVDPDLLPGCTGVSNTTVTISGRDVESTEDFRQRLRTVPESRSTCGPRNAYEAAALAASENVADAVALGPDDNYDMAGPGPAAGQIWIMLIKGERDDAGNLISVVPDPDSGLFAAVGDALTAEDVRPLGDELTPLAPRFIDFDAIVTYYIGASRSKQASQIQVAVQEAFATYLLWQQSKIGRDINPSELTARLLGAGAKRVAITEPAFTALLKDQSARNVYQFLGYGGVEDD